MTRIRANKRKRIVELWSRAVTKRCNGIVTTMSIAMLVVNNIAPYSLPEPKTGKS
jgi:hypothetical protein